MSYYYRGAGDYATGGYGRGMGDPGLFGFLGKIVKKAAPVLGRFFGPVGTIVGAAIGASEATKALMPAPPMALGPLAAPPSMPGIGMIAGQTIGAAAGAYAATRPMAGMCPSGYHPAKDGSGRCVRNRRMNVANPRALRRSIRRVKGFDKLARKSIRIIKRVR